MPEAIIEEPGLESVNVESTSTIKINPDPSDPEYFEKVRQNAAEDHEDSLHNRGN